jgi:hypothetical protein
MSAVSRAIYEDQVFAKQNEVGRLPWLFIIVQLVSTPTGDNTRPFG